MAVNLSTSDSGEKNQVAISGGALSGIAIILLLVLLLWVGLFVYGKYLDKKISDAEISYKGYVKELSNGDSPKVIDFQRRLEISKNLVEMGRNTQEDLAQIELLMIPTAYLKSYSYDDEKNKLTLSFVGDNFNTMAKQILSIKNSDYFSSVIAGTSTVDSKTNAVDFTIEAVLSSKNK